MGKVKGKKLLLFVLAICCFAMAFGINLWGENKTVFAEDTQIIEFRDMIARANNEDYSLVEQGMYRYRRSNVGEEVKSSEYLGKVQNGFIGKTFRFAFSFADVGAGGAEVELFFGNSNNPQAQDSYVFRLGNYGSPYVGIGRGGINDTYVPRVYASVSDGQVYETQISFRQNYVVDGITYAEVAELEVFNTDGQVVASKTMTYEESFLSAGDGYVSINKKGIMDLSLGDKSWFEGELAVEESVIDICKVTSISENGTKNNIHVSAYPTYKLNQLIEFNFVSSDQSRIVLRTFNNINNNLTLGANSVVLEKEKITVGINGVAGASVIAYDKAAVTPWYQANQTYKMQFGFLQYVKDGVPTHNDLVCRIFNSEGTLVFDGTVTLDPSRTQNLSGFYFDGTENTFTVTPIEYVEPCVVTVEYPKETKTYNMFVGDAFSLNAEELPGYEFKKWQKWNGSDYEDLTGEASEIVLEGDLKLKAVFDLVSYNILYELDGGQNAIENPAVYTVEDEVVFSSPVKDGYFFIGWFNGEEIVKGIEKGTCGDLSLTARFVKNILPNTLTYYAGEKFTAPEITGLPDEAVYSVALQNEAGETISPEGDEYAVFKSGNYSLIYDIDTGVEKYVYKIEVAIVNESAEGCRLDGMNVILSDEIAINYFVVLSDAYTKPYLICHFNGQDFEISDYSVEEGRYVFRFDKVTAAYLSSGISVIVKAYDVENVECQVAVKDEYSIRDYCTALLTKSAQQLGMSAEKYAAMQTLVVDLLNYGAAAQKYLKVNVDDLANNNLTDELKEKATDFAIPADRYAVSDETDKTVIFRAARLVFDCKIGISVAFKVNDNVDYSGYQVVFAIGNKEYKVTADQFVNSEINGNSYLVAEFREIYANCFDSLVTVKVIDSNGAAVSGQLSYSVNSFIARHNTEELYQKLYCYGASAKEYCETV